MRFEEVYDRWTEDRLTQREVADVLGVCERQFRRQCRRYESDGIDGLIDLRLGQLSSRRAPVDEVLRLVAQYRDRYVGWTVKHFYSKYQGQKGRRSYNFVRLTLQRQGVVRQVKRRGAHRRKRERKPLIGMMLHQDGSRHEWLRGQQHDLIGIALGRPAHFMRVGSPVSRNRRARKLSSALQWENLCALRECVYRVGVLLHHLPTLGKVFSLVVGTAHVVSLAVRELPFDRIRPEPGFVEHRRRHRAEAMA